MDLILSAQILRKERELNTILITLIKLRCNVFFASVRGNFGGSGVELHQRGFAPIIIDKSNVAASSLIRKGVTVNQLQQNNQLIPMDLRIKVDIATAI